MKATPICSAFLFAAVIFIGCQTEIEKEKQTAADTVIATTARIDSTGYDTIGVKEPFSQEEIPVNNYLNNRLKTIRENFERINSINSWTSADTIGIQETPEGGEAAFYYINGTPEKIVTRQFGETYQVLTEYYLLKGKMSFVFEKMYKYNRPINYDSATMIANDDVEFFDLAKSIIVETRSYFENGKLIHQLCDEDRGALIDDKYLLAEQKRIKADFDKLFKLKNKFKSQREKPL